MLIRVVGHRSVLSKVHRGVRGKHIIVTLSRCMPVSCMSPEVLTLQPHISTREEDARGTRLCFLRIERAVISYLKMKTIATPAKCSSVIIVDLSANSLSLEDVAGWR